MYPAIRPKDLGIDIRPVPPIEPQLEQIREQQRAIWNKFFAGRMKGEELTMDFLKPIVDEIIRLLAPKDGDVILDAAAPVVAGLSKADGATVAKIKSEVSLAVRERFRSGELRLVGNALVLYGEKL